MVRGPADQFAYKIERIRYEEGFKGGTVITKMQDDGNGELYGPYATLISPPSHGREWFHLGKYEEEIDIDERAEMDYKRLIFRKKEAGSVFDWGDDELSESQQRVLDEGVPDDKEIDHYSHTYGIRIDHLREAKEAEEGYKQAWRDTLFSRWAFRFPNERQRKITRKFLRHIREEFLELHLDDDEELVDVDLLFEKEAEWGKLPSDYERFREAVESGEEPTFRN